MFGPVTSAISDSWLQIRAKPVVFLLIWLSLAIAPLLVLAVLFLQPLTASVTELMKYFQIILGSGADPSAFVEEYLQAFSRYIGFSLALAGLLIVSSSYLGAVLFGTIGRFRSREIPAFSGALADGAGRFLGLLISVLLTCIRVFLMYLAGSFIGSILGLVINDLFYSPLIITGLFPVCRPTPVWSCTIYSPGHRGWSRELRTYQQGLLPGETPCGFGLVSRGFSGTHAVVLSVLQSLYSAEHHGRCRAIYNGLSAGVLSVPHRGGNDKFHHE